MKTLLVALCLCAVANADRPPVLRGEVVIEIVRQWRESVEGACFASTRQTLQWAHRELAQFGGHSDQARELVLKTDLAAQSIGVR